MDPNQQYVDPAVAAQGQGDASGGALNFDAAMLAAAASQHLEAIQQALALQQQQANGGQGLLPDQVQAAVAGLEHLQHAKPEDYYMHLVGAAAASAAENAVAQAATQQGGEGGMGPGDGGDGGLDTSPANGDKPLTSKFRGVCWNKKNRRWQAAINSSGKYIYLGSFVQEEEAARAFDRAAIRLRGNRAKLNFGLSDYMDDTGQLIDDPRLSAHLQNVLGKEPGKGGGGGGKSGLEGADMHQLLAAQDSSRVLYGNNLAQHILNHGLKSSHYPYSGAQMHNYGVVDVPEGCSLVAHIPGDSEAFAVLYTGPTIPPGGSGATVWDGTGAIDLGVFDTDKDARQAAGVLLKLAMFHRHTLMSTLTAGASLSIDGSGAQPSNSNPGGGVSQYGMLLTGAGDGMGAGDGDAAALAAAATAAATGGDPNVLGQLSLLGAGSGSDVGQFKDILNIWAAYQRNGGKAEDGQSADPATAAAVAAATAAVAAGAPGVVEGGVPLGAGTMMMMDPNDPTAAAAAAAGAGLDLAAVAAAAGLKTVRDEGEAAGGMVGGYGEGMDDGGMAKRARVDDGMAQMNKLSQYRLQDVMKSLFESGGGGAAAGHMQQQQLQQQHHAAGLQQHEAHQV